MIKKEDRVAEVVKIEWEMFQQVANIGGPAGCQQDPETFEVMRSSQAMGWSEAVLESYLNDLREAKAADRNLMTEKYARMMASTSPSEYERIAHFLTPLEPERLAMIDEIAGIVLAWDEELAEKYPRLMETGRPIYSTEDSVYVASIETYLRGELATYSSKTLKLFHENVLNQKADNINGSEIIMSHLVKRYGYGSLEEANEKLKSAGSNTTGPL